MCNKQNDRVYIWHVWCVYACVLACDNKVYIHFSQHLQMRENQYGGSYYCLFHLALVCTTDKNQYSKVLYCDSKPVH